MSPGRALIGTGDRAQAGAVVVGGDGGVMLGEFAAIASQELGRISMARIQAPRAATASACQSRGRRGAGRAA
ncbi:hypothetical protein AWC04_03825 [Mycolicibacterium fallax]|uniref:Uncharacterized protein n=1 Tax=Mycolicibacterium fallax TaxID=1793 RepID=A0A1X1RJ67_MYCFA|nr:hypothetical protein AWC04_03825 [Mycolicibacterium fallax]